MFDALTILLWLVVVAFVAVVIVIGGDGYGYYSWLATLVVVVVFIFSFLFCLFQAIYTPVLLTDELHLTFCYFNLIFFFFGIMASMQLLASRTCTAIVLPTTVALKVFSL